MSYDRAVGWTRAPGGLVSALEPVLRRTPSIWFGHVDRNAPVPATSEVCELAAIVVDAEDRGLALDGFCNQTLWPALHGLRERIVQRDEWWDSYSDLNVRAAQIVARQIAPDSLVWVHDYHYFAFAAALRKLRPGSRIGLFCHTPVVAATLRTLDHAVELFEALSSFDLIGCQTEQDRSEMLDLLAGVARRTPRVITDPVGFDVALWQSFRDDGAVVAGSRNWSTIRGVLAVGVDRVDHSKGLVQKLLAIEMLLDRGGLSPDDFRLVQVANPSRMHVAAYRHLDEQIAATAARINTRFVRHDGALVVELIRHQLSPVEIAGLLRAADLALVTPVRDGMNLVALEYSVLNADRPAGLVLAEGAGAADLIGDWCDLAVGGDVTSLADAIATAVGALHEVSSVERSRRRGSAAAQQTGNQWASMFLNELEHTPKRESTSTVSDQTLHDMSSIDTQGDSTCTPSAISSSTD